MKVNVYMSPTRGTSHRSFARIAVRDLSSASAADLPVPRSWVIICVGFQEIGRAHV